MMIVFMTCGVVIPGAPPPLSAGEVMIIANPSVPSENLAPDAIKNLFLGKTAKWENNDMVTIVVSENADVHKGFLDKYIKRTESQFNNVWRQNLFTGKGTQPVKVHSVEELVDYVSKTKGAIGYTSPGHNLRIFEGLKIQREQGIQCRFVLAMCLAQTSFNFGFK